MKKGIVVLLLAALVALPLSASAGLLKEGDPYVPFTLETAAGGSVDSATLLGKGTIILNFMNTVCSTCVAEMKDIQKALEANPNAKVQYYPVAVDMRGAATVLPFKETMQFPFTFLLDQKFALGRKYGASATPFTAVIDKEGKVVKLIRGYSEESKDAIIGFIK